MSEIARIWMRINLLSFRNLGSQIRAIRSRFQWLWTRSEENWTEEGAWINLFHHVLVFWWWICEGFGLWIFRVFRVCEDENGGGREEERDSDFFDPLLQVSQSAIYMAKLGLGLFCNFWVFEGKKCESEKIIFFSFILKCKWRWKVKEMRCHCRIGHKRKKLS